MAKTTANQEPSSALEVQRAAVLEKVQAAMASMKSEDFDTEQMMFDIMAATSLDEILDSEVLHLKDIIGVPMTVESAQLQDSKYEESFIPAYAVMRVTFDDGTKAIVTTGAAQVVATLIKAQSEGWFPLRVSTTMLTTSKGNDVVKFIKAPEV